MKIKSKDNLAAVLVSCVVGIALGITYLCLADGNPNDANVIGGKDSSIETANRPIIIWYQKVEHDPEILRLAISSGVFSHVMIRGLNEFDRPSYYADLKLKRLLKLCREKGLKVIWERWLYPSYHLKGFTLEDAFDSRYYAERIRNIKAEAKLIGADFVAFDPESYVNCPVKAIANYTLPEARFEVLNNAIQAAIKTEGQVDFVIGAGIIYPWHPYNATKSLGKLTITGHTYFDVPEKLNDNRLPYDIFGASVSITKENKKFPEKPYFTPREILERQELWSHKKGLLIYPGYAENAAAVALEFSKIKTI